MTPRRRPAPDPRAGGSGDANTAPAAAADVERLGELVGRLRAAGCVFAEEEAALLATATEDPAERESWCRRREAGEPLEQIIGWVQFAGDRYRLGPGVFVPRRRSEFLVERALATVPTDLRRPVRVVEMCCGVGAIGLAITRRLLGRKVAVEVHLADIDASALRWADRNGSSLPSPSVHLSIRQGDLWTAVPPDLQGRVDLVVANAPYVPTAELAFLPGEARDHEPAAALDGGADGVDLHRRILADTPRWLAAGGAVLIETSDRQAHLTAAAMTEAGLTVRIDHDAERAATAVTGWQATHRPGRPG